jgi:hypothetical protein
MPQIQRTCQKCGETFHAERYKVERGDGRFCSRSCASSYAASRKHDQYDQSGDSNPNWKGGVSEDPYRYRKRQKKRHPEKVKARKKLQRAVKSGRVSKEPCKDCGAAENLEGHHEDYSKPLEVTWLCKSCHIKRHTQ